MGREARINQDLQVINTRLADYFGRDVVTGVPLHRIIPALKVTEKRRGDFDVQTEGGIFLRTERNTVREVLKYPDFQDYHVFEMFVALHNLDSSQKAEIIPEDSNYSYECFYCFRDKDWNPLPVAWKAVEAIMQYKLYGKRDKSTGRTEDLEVEKQDQKNIAYFEEELGMESNLIDPNYGVKGIFVPSSYEAARYKSGRLVDDSVVENKPGKLIPVVGIGEMQGL